LLCGCLMSQDGWVTRAISIIARRCHWSTYFKLLERGSLKTQALANQLLRLVMQFSPNDILTFVLDDTLLLRWSIVSGDFSSHSFLMPAGAACVHLNHRWTPHDTDSRCPEA
jgi:hypothetical protein